VQRQAFSLSGDQLLQHVELGPSPPRIGAALGWLGKLVANVTTRIGRGLIASIHALPA